MLIESKQQNVDLWEAWIDMQTSSNSAATLYLIGDVFTDDRLAQPFFIKKKNQLQRCCEYCNALDSLIYLY